MTMGTNMATTTRATRTKASTTNPTVIQDPNVEYFDLPDTPANRQLLADLAEYGPESAWVEIRVEGTDVWAGDAIDAAEWLEAQRA